MTSNYTLKLAHINDTHSHFDANRLQFTIYEQQQALTLYTHSGGYPRIGYQLSQARLSAKANHQSFLFLHGGDSFQGTLYFNEFKGKANSDLLNRLKPDAMVLGNHEIDAGNGPVLDFLNDINFPLLAGNMDLSQESSHKASRLSGHRNLYEYDNHSQTAKYILKPLQDKQVAVIGITLEQMHEIAGPDPDTHFLDALETTQRTIAKLHSEGVFHIIVLSHLGLEQDKILAASVDGISLIVGGHSHTLQGDFAELGLSHTPYAERVNNTPIVHAGKYAETIGIADVTFDAQGHVTAIDGSNYFMLDQQFILQASEGEVSAEHYLAIRAKLDANPAIFWDGEDTQVQQTILEKYRPKIDALNNQILGFVPKNLIHTRLPSKVLPHGSEIAPWVSRSMFAETKHCGINVDFALHNAGGVRQSLNKGQLSHAEVIGRILPFDLPLVTYQIQGRYLFEMLESAINAATNNGVIGTGAGSFPYTYGLKYFYDGKQSLGYRIIKIEIMRQVAGQTVWIDIDRNQDYIGVSSAYTASGKEGYSPILQSNWLQSVEHLTLPGAFIQFLGRSQPFTEAIEPQVYYTSQHS
ncbi:bifunctional metallophosphatase/5'-nucleotidase [Shewanella youngdeokensis]|uniref:Bifunctional metallophosphatase/5'-nucleotidase n=1 Tax=Shewanella youngdeokensis TaxID=2999068 RepID=A0ABZ0K2H4_9GAMM|nr:bifunctional metallophosphatase/5'-nucleotidase [Shewanella sp. DAU334]